MRVGVDIDDVLFGWWAKAHQASLRAGITNGNEPRSWNHHEEYGCSKQAWLDALEVATLDGSLYTGKPLPGAVDALRRIHAAGHTIHLVTARGFFKNGDRIRTYTVEWIRDWAIPHDSLTFVKDKGLLRLDVAVDDAFHNVVAMSKAGVTSYLVTRPHNLTNIWSPRVKDVTEFADIVSALAP